MGLGIFVISSGEMYFLHMLLGNCNSNFQKYLEHLMSIICDNDDNVENS